MSARQPAGIPAGGQFAATARAEPGIALRAPAVTAPSGVPAVDDFASVDNTPAKEMGPAQVAVWSGGEISHHLSPAIGLLRYYAHKDAGVDLQMVKLNTAFATAGASIATKFGNGTTREPAVAPDAEDRLERLQLKPGADMGPDEIKDWVTLELRDRLIPLRDKIIDEAKTGNNTLSLTGQFMDTAKGFGSDIAAKFRPGPTTEDLA